MRRRRAPELATIGFLVVCLHGYARDTEDKPGPAVEEAFGRTKHFKYAMIYVSFNAGS